MNPAQDGGGLRMALMEWRAEFETHHALIDEQHQALIACFNDLQTAMNKGRGRAEVRKTLMFLTTYTLQHFSMEEELMAQHGYPDVQKHKEFHHNFVVRLSGLMDTYVEHGPAVLTTTTLDFMAGWLVEHIQGEDCHMAEFLRRQA